MRKLMLTIAISAPLFLALSAPLFAASIRDLDWSRHDPVTIPADYDFHAGCGRNVSHQVSHQVSYNPDLLIFTDPYPVTPLTTPEPNTGVILGLALICGLLACSPGRLR